VTVAIVILSAFAKLESVPLIATSDYNIDTPEFDASPIYHPTVTHPKVLKLCICRPDLLIERALTQFTTKKNHHA
jgi:hypothetical protein